MSLVTLSATYGAGGSLVGPELARRLDVPFVDRVITSEPATRSVLLDAAASGDDVSTSHLLSRLLRSMAPIGQAYGIGGSETGADRESQTADAAERAIYERADCGEGVILGRAAALVLRDDPRATHVRLDGPREARLEQAMRIEGIDRDTADQRMEVTDDARHKYVRHFRRADARDPSHYHLLIDSTEIDLDTCVEMIALAAAGRAAAGASRPRDLLRASK